MNKEEAQIKLEALEQKRIKGIGYHGYEWCDTPYYQELLAQMEEYRTIIMAPEPSKVSEATFRSKW
jgi:hypothetical protein